MAGQDLDAIDQTLRDAIVPAGDTDWQIEVPEIESSDGLNREFDAYSPTSPMSWIVQVASAPGYSWSWVSIERRRQVPLPLVLPGAISGDPQPGIDAAIAAGGDVVRWRWVNGDSSLGESGVTRNRREADAEFAATSDMAATAAVLCPQLGATVPDLSSGSGTCSGDTESMWYFLDYEDGGRYLTQYSLDTTQSVTP